MSRESKATTAEDMSKLLTVYPPVLDACCGARMFWFDKTDKRTLYQDHRMETRIVDVGTVATKNRQPKIISPDVLGDFMNMKYPDESFSHVVFDPPHLCKRKVASGVVLFSYGLLTDNWKEDLTKGFRECFRVLKPLGTLIFKWCETDIPLSEVLRLTPNKPLYGHRSGSKAQTHWVAFLKDAA